MAEPIYPPGYTRRKSVFSGIVPDKPRGVLPLETPAKGFFLVHAIDRILPMTPALFDFKGHGGFWTVQIRESAADNAKILFEQSVMLSTVIVGGFGGLVTLWYEVAAHHYRFKTRICNGQFLEPIIPPYDTGHGPPPDSDGVRPERPGLVRLSSVKVDLVDVTMPELPERAESLHLLYCKDRYGTYQPVGLDIPPGETRTISVMNLGFVSHNPGLAATELVWWQVEARNAAGSTFSEAFQDTWPVVEDGEQIAGYPGYLHVDSKRPSVYAEEYYLINMAPVGGSLQVRIAADVVCPPYRCEIPQGACLSVESDYWVGRLQDNKLYFSISYLPADLQPGKDGVFDPRTGTLWSLIAENGVVNCGRSTRPETYDRTVDSGVTGGEKYSFVGGHRYGATLLALYGTQDELHAARSMDEGRNWTPAAAQSLMLSGIQALASVRDQNGSILVYGVIPESALIPAVEGAQPGEPVWAELKESEQGLIVASTGLITVGPRTALPRKDIISLHQAGPDFLLLVLEQEQTGVYRSSDNLRTLTKVPAPTAGNPTPAEP